MSLQDWINLVVAFALLALAFNVWRLVKDLIRLSKRWQFTTHRVYKLEGGRCLASCPLCRDLRDIGIEVQP